MRRGKRKQTKPNKITVQHWGRINGNGGDDDLTKPKEDGYDSHHHHRSGRHDGGAVPARILLVVVVVGLQMILKAAIRMGVGPAMGR
uniref:Uncharacterized protein n=1 Tax=Romanomermis culicivorax TaxID=13658 RepID=A0A915IZB6_ROMCU